MSDEVLAQVPTDAAPAVGLTAGALLRKARENAGLHVAALAVSMKVPVKKLEALEADRFELLPDAVFVRALASSVCRTLKIDPTPILSLLPQSTIPRLGSDERGINTPFHASGESKSQTLPDFLKKPVVLLVGALLLGAFLVVFLPEYRTQNAATDLVAEPKAAAEPSMPLAPVFPPGADSTTGVLPDASRMAGAPALPLNPVSVPAVEVSPAVPVKAPASAPVASATPAPVAAIPPSAVNQAATGAVTVALNAKSASWVEVVDAKGVVQIRKTLAAGEKITASGALPLSVVIGRVDAIDVEVRGKPFSLQGIAKDNVARFEVK